MKFGIVLLLLTGILDWSSGQQQPVVVQPNNRDFQLSNRDPRPGIFANPNLNNIDPFSSRRPTAFFGDANTNIIFEEP